MRWLSSFVGLIRSRDAYQTGGGIEGALSGYYEVRPGRVVGWIQDRHGPPRGPLSIHLVRYGRTLLSCDVVKTTDAPRFVFEMGIDGICTTAELFSEQAKLIAKNVRGDTGNLLIDGANALEVIRDVAGVPATKILDLSFGNEGNARGYLGGGWSGVENDLTWTEDYDSFVFLDRPHEAGTYALRISAGALISKPAVTSQILMVFVNETCVSQFELKEGNVQFMECKIAGELLLSADRTTLRLHHPNAARPSDLTASKDSRLLALRFKRLSLARLHE